MSKSIIFGALALALALGACTAGQIENNSAKVQAACQEALPLASAAALLPLAGPYVALGVQVGCGSASGLAKLAGDPSSAEWLAQQSQILKASLLTVQKK